MATSTGDLWPRASGSASLGVEQINGTGGFTGRIRPYRHIHMISGVWHSSLHGSSGIIRFNGENAAPQSEPLPSLSVPGFDMSFDGGGSFPVRIGQALQLPETPVSIQTNDSQALYIKASGNASIFSELGVHIEGIGGNLTLRSGKNFDISAQEISSIVAGPGSIFFNNGIQLTGSNIGNVIEATTLEGDIELKAGLANRDYGNILIRPFAGSGQLEYHFGPNEAWHTTVGAGNLDLVPIPHSGHVAQMARSIPTLYDVYRNEHSLYIDFGNLIFSSTDGKVVFGTDGVLAPIRMSGIAIQLAGPNLETGDLTAYTHSDVTPAESKSNNPFTTAIAQAQSLGPSTLQYNTGSGLINVSTGSGCMQMLTLANLTLNAGPAGLLFSAVGYTVRDNSFHKEAGNTSGVRILVPGLYELTYKVGVQKNVGTTNQAAYGYIVKNNVEILASRSYAIVLNATVGRNNTLNSSVLFDAEANDQIAIAVGLVNHVGGETVVALGRTSNIILKYIGPRRATISTL